MTCVTIRGPVRMKMMVRLLKLVQILRKWVQEKCLFRNDVYVKWCSFPGSRAMMMTMMTVMMMMVVMMLMMIVVGAVKSNVV